MTKKTHVPEDANGSDHLGQIRDIIFGEQKREFDDRINTLEEALEERTADLAGKLHTLDDRMSKSLEEAVRNVTRRIESAMASAQTDGSTLRSQLQQVHGELSKRLEMLTAENASAAASLRNEISAVNKAAHAALDEVRETLKSDLDSQAAFLKNDKISRELLADLLQELAGRLRQVGGSVEERLPSGTSRKNP